MMKDKLTKSNDSRFDRLCNRLRSFGICLFVVSAISFLPINHKLQVDNEVMAFEIGSLKEEEKDATFYLVEGADHGHPYFWCEPTLSLIEQFFKKYMK